MKFCCIGDPHFKETNVQDCEMLIDKLVTLISSIEPEFVVIMGDIMHEHSKAYYGPFQLAQNLIEQLSQITHVFVIIGNHDYINASQFQTDKHFFNALKKWDNVEVIDTFTTKTFGQFTFGFCPFVPKGRFMEALNGSGKVWEICDAIFAHQEFKGCKMESGDNSKNGDEWPQDNPLIISGHIHIHQIVNDNIFYTGSIMQHGYTDTTEKLLWMFEFNMDENNDILYTHSGYDLNIKKKKKITHALENINKFDHKQYKDYNIQLELSGSSEDIKSFKNTKKYKEYESMENIIIKFDTISKSIIKKDSIINDCKSKNYLEIFEELCKKDDLGDLYKEVIKNVI